MVLQDVLRTLFERLIRRVVARYTSAILVVALGVTALSVWVMATRWNINSDLNALLPESSPAATAMREVSARMGSGSSLFVVIDSPDQEATLRFAGDYTARLREMPGIALAHYHNDKAFFEQHQLLYVSEEDLGHLYTEVREAIRQRKKEANPLFVSLGSAKKKSQEAESARAANFAQMQQRYAEEMAHQNYKEYLFSDDGYALVVIVRFVESSTDMVATNKLIDAVRDVAAELNPASYHADGVGVWGRIGESSAAV